MCKKFPTLPRMTVPWRWQRGGGSEVTGQSHPTIFFLALVYDFLKWCKGHQPQPSQIVTAATIQYNGQARALVRIRGDTTLSLVWNLLISGSRLPAFTHQHNQWTEIPSAKCVLPFQKHHWALNLPDRINLVPDRVIHKLGSYKHMALSQEPPQSWSLLPMPFTVLGRLYKTMPLQTWEGNAEHVVSQHSECQSFSCMLTRN